MGVRSNSSLVCTYSVVYSVVLRKRVVAGAGVVHSVQQRDVGFYEHTSSVSSPAHKSGVVLAIVVQ